MKVAVLYLLLSVSNIANGNCFDVYTVARFEIPSMVRVFVKNRNHKVNIDRASQNYLNDILSVGARGLLMPSATNAERISERNGLLLTAYSRYMHQMVKNIDILRESASFVYPLQGPDVVFYQFGEVFAVNREEGDIEIGRRLLKNAGLPGVKIIDSPSRLIDDPKVIEYLSSTSSSRRTLVLKKFALFSKAVYNQERLHVLEPYLENVEHVLVLDNEDNVTFSQTIVAAGFKRVVSTDRFYESYTLAIGDSGKSMMIPDQFVLFSKG